MAEPPALADRLVTPADALAGLWTSLALAPDALDRVALSGDGPVLPSSFAVDVAVQASLAAAALAATELGRLRNGVVQGVAVARDDAAAEATAAFKIDDRTPQVWDKLAGLYRCRDGWLRLHTNFAHHRDGVLRLLGLPPGPDTAREAVAAALATRDAEAFEGEASDAGLVVAACRRTAEWRRHPQHAADAAAPLIDLVRIGDAAPLAWPDLAHDATPLTGLRMLDLTRILGGPVGTRTLAAYGGDVMLVNSPTLPNIDAIADLSRGKRSALSDLRSDAGRRDFTAALAGAHVLVESYRPGALAGLGFGAADAARIRPGLVYVSLSAYSSEGPWSKKRGFDSLVQTATGINDDEAGAAGSAEPKALPVQVLDIASGFLIAYATAAALLRQRREGGSWHARVSLSRTALWLRSLGRRVDGFAAPMPELASRFEISESGFGRLSALRHGARLEKTPARFDRPSLRPGSAALRW